MKNKCYIVTGASSGIGLAITQALLEQGSRVIGIARHVSKLENMGDAFIPVQIDLSDITNLPTQLDKLISSHQEIDGVILNAGKGRFGSLEEFSYKQIDDLISLNLTSNLYLLKTLLPVLKKKKKTDIILIGSEASLAGGKYGSVYCASKFAIRGLAQSIRQECNRQGVRVCLINPGAVDTPFFDDLNFAPEQGSEFSIDVDSIANTVLHALSLPAEVVLEEINVQPLKRVFIKK